MPLYFAYGSNMDEAAIRSRCPKARTLGLARLARHRFMLMSNGFASVRRDPSADVHGVLFDLALSDIRPLDRYEAIDSGFYTKVVQPVVRHKGLPVQALLYIGNDRNVGSDGADPSYMIGIVAAARAMGLPPAYVGMLERFTQQRGSAPLPAQTAIPRRPLRPLP